MKIRALIVDDDIISRAYLRHLLSAHDNVIVAGEAETLVAARDFLANATCDLVLLDIALGSSNGFELVPYLPATTRVIFVTAHGDHALRAFEVAALDYLLKPVNPARLTVALSRCQPKSHPAEPKPDPVMHLQDGAHARLARLADICAVEAEENYTRVHHRDGSTTLVRRPLKAWENLLPVADFLRIHRTVIVNLSQITSYSRDPDGGISIVLKTSTKPFPVGRTFWLTLKARLSPDVHSGSPFIPTEDAARQGVI